MSLLVLADAQSRVGPDVTQELIDEEEAWLASELGPLTGERTETYFLPSHLQGVVDAVYLSRRTDAVDSFTADGDAMADWRLLENYIVERYSDSSEAWDGELVATYTPNDEAIIKGIVYDAIQYRLIQPGLQSVKIGEYSETYATGATTRVGPVHRALLNRAQPSVGLGAYARPFRFRHTARDRSLVEQAGS